MRYLMQQKLLAAGDDFAVKNEQGTEMYYVDGKVLTIGKKLIVLDRNRNEIARIRQRFFTVRPTFNIFIEKEFAARVFKRLFTFRNAFVVDVPGPNDYSVVGKLLEHEYTFHRNGKQVAVVSKQYFRAADTYGIDINGGENDLLIICAAVAIDLIVHPKRDSSFST